MDSTTDQAVGTYSELTIRRRRRLGGGLRLEGCLRAPSGHEHVLFYEVPRAQAGWATKLADPFVVALLMPMMRLGAPVRVRGAVTARLLEQLIEFQRIFVQWYPDLLREVELHPDTIARPRRLPREPRPLLAFSGGVDSLFSAWTWNGPERKRSRMKWAVMAHGFDVGLEGVDFFQRQFDEGRAILAARDIALFPVRSNSMEPSGVYGLRWGKTLHGPSTAALLLLFQKEFDLGLFSSSYPASNLLIPWGSTPLTDPLLGSGEMAIIHYGASFERTRKIKALADWPEALSRVRVCWQWPRTEINCGVCYKCMQFRLHLIMAGAPDAVSFPQPLTSEMVEAFVPEDRHSVRNWIRAVELAEQWSPDAPWLESMRAVVRRGRAVRGAPEA